MPVKLLYITNGIDGPGGLERVLSIKASYLADHMDYKVHIASLFEPVNDLFYEFSPRIRFHFLKVNTRRFIYPFSYASRIRSIIKDLNPDILLVCDDGLKGLLIPFLIRKKQVTIYERHVSKRAEVQVVKVSWIKRVISDITFFLMNLGGAKFDAFVVLTEGNLKEWPLRNLHVIPNPLSFYPNPSDLSTLEEKTFIAVGKQSFQKGYERLLEAWQIATKNNKDWTLEIYGKKNPELGLEEQALNLGIREQVRFFNPVKDIGEKYRKASVCVLSSRYEGFGMVLTEAMSYGLPCISFDCPHGPADIIKHESNGLLIKNGDIEGLARAMVSLMDFNKRSYLGKNARRDVGVYQPSEICKEWDNLFAGLL